ncbi:MAG: hypothetical protein WA619_21320, partial [Candidatus Acidiferrum sp.]
GDSVQISAGNSRSGDQKAPGQVSRMRGALKGGAFAAAPLAKAGAELPHSKLGQHPRDRMEAKEKEERAEIKTAKKK